MLAVHQNKVFLSNEPLFQVSENWSNFDSLNYTKNQTSQRAFMRNSLV
jgi:hypothetical protein